MRIIVVFFALALLFTFAYCKTFIATGIMYCPSSKREWTYAVQLWEEKAGQPGKVIGNVTGKTDAQLQFYEIRGEAEMDDVFYAHFGINLVNDCLGKHADVWTGYQMIVQLDGRETYYGFSAHDLTDPK